MSKHKIKKFRIRYLFPYQQHFLLIALYLILDVRSSWRPHEEILDPTSYTQLANKYDIKLTVCIQIFTPSMIFCVY